MALSIFTHYRLPMPFDYVTETVFEIPSTQGTKVSNHHLRVVLILGGEAHFRSGERPPILLRAGDALVLTQPTAYAYLPVVPGRSTRIQALAISLKRESRAASLSRQLIGRYPKSGHHPAILNAHRLHLIHQIRSEAENDAKDSPLAVAALATLLLLDLIRDHSPTPTQLARPKHSGTYLVEQAREYVFKNYSRPLTLADIAWNLRLSEEYLARLFKKITGQTVFEYVRELRLNTAKRLLAGTNHPITQISELTGFSAPTIFCRTFRAAFGHSPTDYRASLASHPFPTPPPIKKSKQAH